MLLKIIPWVLFAVLLLGNVLGWRDAQQLGQQLVLNQAANTAEEVALRIGLYLRERANNLALLTSLWRESTDRRGSDLFLKYAGRLVEQAPNYDVVVYLDGQSMLMVSSPEPHGGKLIGLDLESRPLDQDLLDKVRDALTVVSPTPIGRLIGDRGLALWSPILIQDGQAVTMKGVIAGTMNLSQVIGPAVRPANHNDFWIKIQVGGTTVFNTSREPSTESDPDQHPASTYRLNLLDTSWQITVRAKGGGMWRQLSASNLWRLGLQVMLSTLASILLAWALGMLGRVQEKSRELKQSQERYQTLVDSATDVIMVFDAEGRLLDLNRAGRQVWGQSGEGLLGRNLLDLISPDQQAVLSEKLTEIKDNQSAFFETTLRAGNGTNLPVELSARIIEYQGRAAILGLARDISQRLKDRTALEESERRFRAIFEYAPVGIAQVTPKGEFLRVNPKFLEIIGYSREEIHSLNLKDVTHPEDWSVTQEVIDQALSGQIEAVSREKRYSHKNGSTVWAAISSSLVKAAEERASYFIDVINDITAKAQLERQLRQAQKMEAIGTLAGGIAHDFNNILGAILGYTQLASMEALPGTKMKTRLDGVFKAATVAKDLVRQVLTFSRMTEQAFRPVNIVPVVKETIKLLRASLPATIQIDQTLDPEVGPVLADPIQIQQLVMNLVTNAAQAVAENQGVLKVTLTRVCSPIGQEIDGPRLEPSDWVKFSVEDNGTGIAPEIMDRIFEPYFTTKTVDEGTGLGLAVVHGIVQGHGGQIKVDSRPGLGTKVHVYLPAATEAIMEKRTPAMDLPRGNETILAVEDDRSLLEVLAEMLEYLGYSVDQASGGVQAWEKFQVAPDRYQILITDLTMPRMTGTDLAREVKKLRPMLPVLLTTGNDQRLDLDELMRLGISGLLVKPFIIEELAVALRRAIEAGT